MSITNNEPYERLQGNGTSTGYSFKFDLKAGEENHLEVIYYKRRMNPRRLKAGVDFDLVLREGVVGGSINLYEIKPLSVDYLELFRRTPIEQNVIFDNNKNIIPKNIEQVADTGIKIDQELQYQIKAHQIILDNVKVTFDTVIRDVNDLKLKAEEASNKAEKSEKMAEYYAHLTFVYKESAKASANSAGNFALDALKYKNLAKDWAVKMGEPVEGDEYSSKYWALQSEQSKSRSDIPFARDGEPGDSIVVNDARDAYTLTPLLSESRYRQLSVSSGEVLLNARSTGLSGIRFLDTGTFAVVSDSTITNQESLFNVNSLTANVSALALVEFVPFYYIYSGPSEDVEALAGDMWSGRFEGATVGDKIQFTKPDVLYKFIPFFEAHVSRLRWSFETYNLRDLTLQIKYYDEDKALMFETDVIPFANSKEIIIEGSGLLLEKDAVYYVSVDVKGVVSSTNGSGRCFPSSPLRADVDLNPYELGIPPTADYGFPPRRELKNTELLSYEFALDSFRVVTDEFEPVDVKIETASVLNGAYNGDFQYGSLKITFFHEGGESSYSIYPSPSYSGVVIINESFTALSKVVYRFEGVGTDWNTSSLTGLSLNSGERTVCIVTYVMHGTSIKPLTFKSVPHALPIGTKKVWLRFSMTSFTAPVLKIVVTAQDGTDMELLKENVSRTSGDHFVELTFENPAGNASFVINFWQLSDNKITLTSLEMIPEGENPEQTWLAQIVKG